MLQIVLNYLYYNKLKDGMFEFYIHRIPVTFKLMCMFKTNCNFTQNIKKLKKVHKLFNTKLNINCK